MKKTVLKFGLYSGVLIVALFITTYAFMDSLSLQTMEILGYLSMFVALLVVFPGIRSYRDNEKNGFIGFGRALGLGMLISLVPALMFGIFDAIYAHVINPGFYAEYMANMTKSMSPDQLAEYTKMMTDPSMQFWMSPFGTFLLMFITVCAIGFIVSLISSMILRRVPKTA